MGLDRHLSLSSPPLSRQEITSHLLLEYILHEILFWWRLLVLVCTTSLTASTVRVCCTVSPSHRAHSTSNPTMALMKAEQGEGLSM